MRVSGGAGKDVLDDSKSGGTQFYDVDGPTEVVKGPGDRGLGPEVDPGLPGPGHAVDQQAGLRLAHSLPAARLVGAGPGRRRFDRCDPLRLRLPQGALLHDAARGGRVEDQAQRVRRLLHRRLPVDPARASRPCSSFRRRREELQLLRRRERDDGHRERVHRGRPADPRGVPFARRLREPSADLLDRPRSRRQVRAQQGRGATP